MDELKAAIETAKPDIKDVDKHIKSIISSPAFAEFNNAMPRLQEMVISIVETQPDRILVAGRHAESIYDALKTVLAGTSLCDKVMLFPTTSGLRADLLKKAESQEDKVAVTHGFLSRYGITEEAIMSGERIALVDLGFAADTCAELYALAEICYPSINRKDIEDAITPMYVKGKSEDLANVLVKQPRYHYAYSSIGDDLTLIPGAKPTGPNDTVDPVSAMIFQKITVEYFLRERQEIRQKINMALKEREARIGGEGLAPSIKPDVQDEIDRLQVIRSASNITGVSLNRFERIAVKNMSLELARLLELDNPHRAGASRHVKLAFMKIRDMLPTDDMLQKADDRTRRLAGLKKQSINEFLNLLDERSGYTKFNYDNLAYQALVDVARRFPKRLLDTGIDRSIHHGFVWNRALRDNEVFGELTALIPEDEARLREQVVSYRGNGLMWHQLPSEVRRLITRIFPSNKTPWDIAVHDAESLKDAVTHVAMQHFSDGVVNLRLKFNIEAVRAKLGNLGIADTINAAIDGLKNAERLAGIEYPGRSFKSSISISFDRHDPDHGQIGRASCRERV